MPSSNNITSKTVCVYPWIHVHAWADGKAFLCCMYDVNKPIGNIKNTGLNGTINSKSSKDIRHRMINDKKVAGCEKCYKLEELGQPSMRVDGFKYYPEWQDYVAATNEDGSIDNFQLKYLDIRYSNLCNFACVTCSPTFSSKWASDWEKLKQPLYHKANLKLDIWDELEPYLLNVKTVNFAGGEPLLMEDHWKIMNYWIANGKTDQWINYTTNLSELTFKGQHIADLWAKFPNITLLISVDGAEQVGEWIRWGLEWEKLIANIQLIQQRCPNIRIQITPTLSVYNVLDLFNAQRILHERAGIVPQQWQLNVLHYPPHLKAVNVPNSVKAQFVAAWNAHKEWLAANNLTDTMFNSVHQEIAASGNYNDFGNAIDYARQLDSIRGTDSATLIPYLTNK